MGRLLERIETSVITIDREPYIRESSIKGLLIIKRPKYLDARGNFQENYRLPDIIEAIGRPVNFLQCQDSFSRPRVLRGIHAEPQDKIITPMTGQMVTVIVDLRRNSETFLKWVMFDFDNRDPSRPTTSLFVPEGLGNSFCVYGTEPVWYKYGVSKIYDPQTAGKGVHWQDETLSIPWPVEEPIISERDENLPSLQEFLFQ
jgi:dTDP-4-dehydrorhamnose 3,5-epimerase